VRNEEVAMRIRRTFPSALAVLGVFCLLASSGEVAPSAKARAVFRKTSHNFGKVKQGDVLTCEFVFKNAGTDALVVERLDTSCGCAAALVSAERIEAGGEGKIKVTVDTHGYSGKFTRYIFFSSNDGNERRRELSVTMDIEVPPQPRMDLDKYNIDLGLSLEGESPSVTVKIKSVGERELQIEMAQHPEIRYFTGQKPLSFPLRIPAGNSVDVEFRFEPQSRTGMLRDYVLIRSNDPIRSTYSVYISRYVVTRNELKDLFEKYGSVLGIKK
jgi:hypothetical protein